jgi:hypothetical protein
MSISSISSSSSAYQSRFQELKKDFSTLQESLSSGDLTTAQNAFTTLMQDLQAGQQTGASGQASADLAAVGTALQSGDLTTAQNAFTTLTKDLQNLQQTQTGQQVYKGHHHHHHGGGSKTADTTLNNDLAAVGTALQSGDLTTAQNAFATLMQDLGNSGTTGASGNSNSLLAAGSYINVAV